MSNHLFVLQGKPPPQPAPPSDACALLAASPLDSGLCTPTGLWLARPPPGTDAAERARSPPPFTASQRAPLSLLLRRSQVPAHPFEL